MSLTNPEVRSVISSLPDKERRAWITLMARLEKDKRDEARKLRRELAQMAAATAKAKGEQRDVFIRLFTKFIDDLGPVSRKDQAERLLKQSRSDSDKAATALKQLANEQTPSDAERSLITNTGKLSLASYYTAPLKQGDRPRAIPTTSVGAYAIFGRLVDDPGLTPRLDDYVSQEVSLDLGEQLVENKAAAETAIRDNIKTFLNENPQGMQLMQRIAAGGGATYTSHSSAITDALAQSLANSISIRSRQTYYENQQSEANANVAALESGDEGKIGEVISAEYPDYLQRAAAEAAKVMGLIDQYYPYDTPGGAEAPSAGTVSVEGAATAAGGNLEDFISFLGSDPDAARSLSRALDPIQRTVLDFERNRVKANEDPRFLLWRQQTGSTGEGVPGYREFQNYNRQVLRAQRGGVFGPATKRTGDVRLIAYRDRSGAVDTDSGALYFFNRETGEPADIQNLSNRGDAQVRDAPVVMFDFQDGADSDGKPIINTGLRNAIGVSVAELLSDDALNALRSEGTRVLYDKELGDFVVLDKDRKVLAKSTVQGPEAAQLMAYASNSDSADVLGDAAGFQRGDSDNRVQSGALAKLVEGSQANQFATYVPEGFGYTVEAPKKYVSGELVYVPGQGMVANIMDRGARGRGDESLLSIPSEDIIFASSQGAEGYGQGVEAFRELLANDASLTEEDRSRILETSTFSEDERKKAFRRPLRMVVNDLFKGRERRARVAAKQATGPTRTPTGVPELVLGEEDPTIGVDPVEDRGDEKPTTPLRDALRDSARSAGRGGRGAGSGAGTGAGPGADEATPPLRLPPAQEPTIYQGDTPDIDDLQRLHDNMPLDPDVPIYGPQQPAAPGSTGFVLPVRHGGRGFSFDAGDRVGPAFSAIGTALKTLNDPAARHKAVRDLGLSLDESADEPAPTEKKEEEEDKDKGNAPRTS